MPSKVYIIGLGVEGRGSLSGKAMGLVRSASLLIGGERHLDEFPDYKGERFALKSNLQEMLYVIQTHPHSDPFPDEEGKSFNSALRTPHSALIAVLASGDPGLYGIADYLTRNLGRGAVEIIPNVSAMQWAFAKAKASWNDARIVSSHGRGMDNVLEASRDAEKIGIFTSNGDEPSEIAKLLIDNGLTDFTAYICENLGMETERVSEMALAEVMGKGFAALNVMVLVRNNPLWSPLKLRGDQRGFIFGLPDSSFSHSKNLITKEEVRAVSLAKLRLREDSVIWDIGAGSGSVGIEAARLARYGKVFAIEKEAERVANIRANIEKFGVKNLEIFEGKAPEGLERFADTDAVFIGGSGGNLSDILDVVKTRLKPSGRIVINAITLETLHEATTGLKERGFAVDVVSLNISRSKDLIGMKMFEAENPVFIITGKRKN